MKIQKSLLGRLLQRRHIITAHLQISLYLLKFRYVLVARALAVYPIVDCLLWGMLHHFLLVPGKGKIQPHLVYLLGNCLLRLYHREQGGIYLKRHFMVFFLQVFQGPVPSPVRIRTRTPWAAPCHATGAQWDLKTSSTTSLRRPPLLGSHQSRSSPFTGSHNFSSIIMLLNQSISF